MAPRREKAARLSRKGPKAGQGCLPALSLGGRARVAAEKIVPPRQRPPQSKLSTTKKDSLDEASRATTPHGRLRSPKTLLFSKLLAPSFTELSCLQYVELADVPAMAAPGGL